MLVENKSLQEVLQVELQLQASWQRRGSVDSGGAEDCADVPGDLVYVGEHVRNLRRVPPQQDAGPLQPGGWQCHRRRRPLRQPSGHLLGGLLRRRAATEPRGRQLVGHYRAEAAGQWSRHALSQ